jgi:hypothetical protein
MLTLLMSLALSACSPTADGRKSLEFDLRSNDIVVLARLAGGGPFRFLVDTGASRSSISARVTAGLAPAHGPATLMMTPAGHRVRPTVDVGLQLGGLPDVTVRATVVADEQLADAAAGIDGIIGQDILAPLAYTIDYERRVIVWGGEECGGVRLPLDLTTGGALVSLTSHDRALRLIPDTGTDTFLLYARPGQPLPAVTPLDVALLRTLSGQRLVRRVLVDRLQLGSIALRDVPAVVLEGRQSHAALGDGLLPLHGFARVTFNGPGGYLAIER